MRVALSEKKARKLALKYHVPVNNLKMVLHRGDRKDLIFVMDDGTQRRVETNKAGRA